MKSVLRKLSSGSLINEQTNEVENWTTKLFKDLVGISQQENYEEFVEFLQKTRICFCFQKVWKRYQ